MFEFQKQIQLITTLFNSKKTVVYKQLNKD